MWRRLVPHPLLSAFLLLVWVLLAGSAAPGSLVLGAVVGLVLAPLAGRLWTDMPHFHRPRVLLRFVPLVLWDILVANVSVAWLTLTKPNRRLRPVFVSIPLTLRDPYGVVALASIITLTPGTVSSQLSADHRTLHVHCLDEADPQAAVDRIKQRYEKPLQELLEC